MKAYNRFGIFVRLRGGLGPMAPR